MENRRRNKTLLIIFYLFFIAIIFRSEINDSYILQGWKKLKLPDSFINQIFIAPHSHSLLAVDRLDGILYLFPEGFSDLSLHKTQAITNETDLFGNSCFFNDGNTLISLISNHVSIYDLNNGTFENPPELLYTQRVFNCTTLNNGDLLITAEQGLIFKDSQGWHKTEFPWLVDYFLAAEDEDGMIWLLDSGGDLFSYDRGTNHITYVINVWFQQPVREMLESNQLNIPAGITAFEHLPGEGFIISSFSPYLTFILSTDKKDVSLIELPELRSGIDCDSYYVNKTSGQIFIVSKDYIYQYNREDLLEGLYSRRYSVPDHVECLAVDTSQNILAVLTYNGVYYQEIKD